MSGRRSHADHVRRAADVARAAGRRLHPRRPLIAASALLVALALQCSNLRAELLFRSAQQVDGQQHWSAPRNYADSADTVYPRTLADGMQVSSEKVRVFLQGFITPQDFYAAKVMASLIKRGRQTIAGNTVSLAGNGGDVEAAMELGRLLRALGLATFVPSGRQCLSSCVFVFMGGTRRTVAGRIGIHRPYLSSTRPVPDRLAYYRRLQKQLRQYVEDLDFPESLYEAIMVVPPESISILTAADLKRFYLQGMSPSTEDAADAAAARKLGISVAQYLQVKAKTEPCGGVFDSDGGCAAGVQTAAGFGAAVEPDGAQISDAPSPAVGSVVPNEKAEAAGLHATRATAAATWLLY
jgi:hypothetical protein